MSDYTLPPLPEHNGWNDQIGKPYWFAAMVLHHGKECAEAARAPLLARIAELERCRRWNVEPIGDGAVQICTGDHEKGESCEWTTYIEAEPVRQRIAELERAASSLLEIVDSASDNGAFWHKPVNRSWDARNHADELNDVLRAEIESARKTVKESGDA